MAKRKPPKITRQHVHEGIRFGKDTALTALAVVLMQDHGFTQDDAGRCVFEAEKLFWRMVAGEPLTPERQAKADELLKKRAIEAEQQAAGDEVV